MNAKKAIVIGCGIAGLATAIRLSAKGYNVVVYEKNSYPGGKLSHFERDGFQFDAGPSLFTQPEQVTELFRLCGEKAESYFTYTRAQIACKYFFESGKIVNAYANADEFADEMATKLGEDKNQVLKYLKTAKSTYHNIGQLFLDYPVNKILKLPFDKIYKALKSTKFSFLFSSLSDYNQGKFRNPETVQIFNRFATYNGSNPYKAPAMLSMIPHLEQNEGTFYPFGGMISITNALYLLALKQNINFVFNSKVTSINLENKRAKSITVHNTEIPADIIVSNMDVYYTYKHLLKDDVKAKNILRQERSSSAIIFYWGMNISFQQLELHNIFFSADYKKEFEAIFEKMELGDDPTIYINITSKMENSQAPVGCENWFVMVNAPHDKGQNWDEFRRKCRTNVITKLNRILKTDISKYIQTEDFLDPTTIDTKTSSYTGSLYGTSSNSKFAAFLRHPNQSKSVDNLYFVGGSVHPGGGIPLCLRSAKIVSELIP
ncbi:MAG TPA: 1-hydroxycarotenoid 3,4-desaturase CrtD [Saprospiraceae bacterium]|nr:1-hydroxycarotenoid 3,4-desaturase CrtD [Saprospiraceae bacterium]